MEVLEVDGGYGIYYSEVSEGRLCLFNDVRE